MVKEVRKLLWLFVVVLLSSYAAAFDFVAEFDPEERSIDQNEIAEYSVTILHDFPSIEFFEIYSPEVLWDIRTKDALQVPTGEEFTTTLTIQPLNINPGLYGVPIHIKRTGTNDFKRSTLYMEVIGSPSSFTYLPAIRGSAHIVDIVDPRDDVIITVNLQNQNRRDHTTLDVKVRSSVINQDFVTTLGPLERKVERFIAKIDPRTAPQIDLLSVTVLATEGDQGFQFDLPPMEYQIRSYGQLTPTIALDESFLKTVRVITVSNQANILLEEPYAYPLNWLARVFTRTDPDARVEDGRFVWDVKLNVGHSMELRVVTNYRPLAIAIILAGLLVVFYFIFRSPLTIKKSATVISTREGGISELKVLLEIKNRANKPIHHVSIVDLVPRIAELIKDTEVGTLAPEKVTRHERKGTLVRYEVGDLMPYEERVISYRVKSSLSILGGVSLPVAVSKFKTDAGRERTTQSNKATITFLG